MTLNPQTIGDIALFVFGAACGVCAAVVFYEVRDNRRTDRLIRAVKSSPRVCAWCGRTLGTVECHSPSHGLCDQCAAEMMREIQS